MTIGYHRAPHLARPGPARCLPLAAPAVLAALAGRCRLVYLRFTDGACWPGSGAPRTARGPSTLLFEKHDARVGRLLAFAVFFPLLYALLTYAWRPLRGLTGWLLIPFGQNALYVYAMHLFAVYFSALLLPCCRGSTA